MARLVIQGDRLVVRLSPLERLGALLPAQPSAPLAAVQSVQAVDCANRSIRGVRAPGTGLPGVIALGTWRHRAGKDFVSVHGRERGVVVELAGTGWSRFVVGSPEPELDASRIQAALAGRAPASPA